MDSFLYWRTFSCFSLLTILYWLSPLTRLRFLQSCRTWNLCPFQSTTLPPPTRVRESFSLSPSWHLFSEGSFLHSHIEWTVKVVARRHPTHTTKIYGSLCINVFLTHQNKIYCYRRISGEAWRTDVVTLSGPKTEPPRDKPVLSTRPLQTLHSLPVVEYWHPRSLSSFETSYVHNTQLDTGDLSIQLQGWGSWNFTLE